MCRVVSSQQKLAMTEHASLRVIQKGCFFSWPTELQLTLLEAVMTSRLGFQILEAAHNTCKSNTSLSLSPDIIV